MNQQFRFRGEEPSRIENLSDAGFALAIGLLLISTSAPQTFDQLLDFTKDILSFAMCITLILLVWYQHVIFFMRYGFRNTRIVVLNTLLLFIILFYVYPLKFLARYLVTLYSALLGIDDTAYGRLQEMIAWDDISSLMIVYGLGASAIFFVLTLMYRYALKEAVALDLNAIELFDTRTSVTTNFLMGLIPLLSVLAASLITNPIWNGSISGFMYFLYFPVMMLYGKRVDRRRSALLNSTEG
jgi:magnesium-transporting ATPase (P-type)